MGERPLKLKPILATLVTLILIFCLSIPANAQVAGAMLTGTVMDSSRSGIPKAKVTITNVATGVARSVETDSAGIYVAPNLTAGTYDVTIEAAGFSTEVERGVVLSVGAKQVLDIPLTVGQLAQTINVTAAAPTVELESSAIGEVVNSTTVRELPLNGRSWTDLANLQPGVVGVETQVPFTSGSNRGSRGFGSQISISGGRPQQNNSARKSGLRRREGYAVLRLIQHRLRALHTVTTRSTGSATRAAGRPRALRRRPAPPSTSTTAPTT